jgi:hypothetical protein
MMISLPFIGNQVKVQRNDGYNDTFSFQAPAGLPGYNAATVGTSTITDFNTAASGTAKIIYNSSNGNIFYNANGAEAGIGNHPHFKQINQDNAPTQQD